jgi:signal transduction histidine kinase
VLFWGLSLLPIKSHSQDSSVSILPIRKQLELYFTELEKTMPHDLAQAQRYLLAAEPLVKSVDSKKYWGRYFQLAGRLATYKKAHARAVRYYFLALDYFQKTRDVNGQVETYLELGDIYLYFFNTQKAIAYYQSGLNLLKGKEQKFKQLAIQLYLQIAKSYTARGQFAMALKALDKGAALAQKTLLYSESSKLWLAYGDIYEQQKKYGQAAKAYTAAWDIAHNQQLKAIEIIVLAKQSKLALQLQQPESARQYAFQQREKAQAIQDQDAFNVSNYQIAQCFFAQKQLDSALHYNTQVIEAEKSQHQDSLLNVVLTLQAKILEQQGQVAAALLVFDELNILDDKQPKAETLNGQRLWEEMTIKRTEEEVQSKLAKALDQRIRLRYLVTFFGVLIALMSLFLLMQARIRKNANRVLDVQNQQIEIQNEQLENLNHVKNQLFAIISHDLRSPLLSVRTVLNKIYQLDTDSANRKWWMQMLHQQSIKTGILFENLLCWASIQMNNYQPINQQFFLLPLVQEIEEEVNFMYQEKQLNYETNITPGIVLNSDPGMIRMAIRNIMANAVKFSNADGKIEITATLNHQEAKISIKDEGIGMKEEEVDKALYGRLSRLGTQAEVGSGIGLSLVRQFLGYQQGHLEIQSAPQEGTTVTIVIPQ